MKSTAERQAFAAGMEWGTRHHAELLSLANVVIAAKRWAYPIEDARIMTAFGLGVAVIRDALLEWDGPLVAASAPEAG